MSQYGSIGAGAFSGDLAREKQEEAEAQAQFNRRMQRRQFEAEQERNKPKTTWVTDRSFGGFKRRRLVNREDLEWEQNNEWKNRERERQEEEWKQQDKNRARAQKREDEVWKQQDEDRARAQKREDEVWKQQDANRAMAQVREYEVWKQQDEDRARAQKRQDEVWKQQDEDRARAQKRQDFQQMLEQDELERKRELRKREDAKWQEMEERNKSAREQQNASFSSLLVNGIRHGKTDSGGKSTMIAPQYLEEFNKQNGTSFGGMMISYKDPKTGADLPFPQVIIYNKGKNGITDFSNPIILSKEQIKGMFASFPDVAQEMADAAGIDLSAGNTWKELLIPDESISSTESKQRVERIKYKIENLEKEKNALMTSGFMPTDKDDPDGSKRKRINEINREIYALSEEWDSLVGIGSGSSSGGAASVGSAGSSSSGVQPQKPGRNLWTPSSKSGVTSGAN